MSLSLYPNVPNRNLFIQDTIPEYAAHGDQWLNTSAGVSLTFIRDNDGYGYWVEVSPTQPLITQ